MIVLNSWFSNVCAIFLMAHGGSNPARMISGRFGVTRVGQFLGSYVKVPRLCLGDKGLLPVYLFTNYYIRNFDGKTNTHSL